MYPLKRLPTTGGSFPWASKTPKVPSWKSCLRTRPKRLFGDLVVATNSSVLNFWNSSEVTRIVKHALADIESQGKNQGDTLRRCSLKSAIIDLNTKGRFLLPPPFFPPRPYCIDQLPSNPDDGAANYIPFRQCLGVVAELLTLFRTKVEQAHGQECWQRTAILFEDGPRSRLRFGLLRDVSAAPRSQAIDILERVSRKGLRLEQLGITRARFRSRDCGLEALVRISTKMLVFLDHLKPADPAPTTAPAPAATSRVTVDTLTKNVVTLRHKGKEAKLSGREREFFLALFWSDNKLLAFDSLWKKLIEDETGKRYRQDPKGGGPPARLRRIKCNTNKKIAKCLGHAPDGQHWINAVKREGYQLNRTSLIWQKSMDAVDRPNELPIDPGQADRRSSKGY